MSLCSQVITTNKISEQKFDMEMAELREFMLQKKIPKPIRREIANFMENFYARATVPGTANEPGRACTCTCRDCLCTVAAGARVLQ